jgi:hypothetical protein
LRAFSSREEYRKIIERHADATSPAALVSDWSDDWEAQTAHFGLSVAYSAPGYGRIRSNGMITLGPNLYTEAPRFAPWKTTADGIAFLSPENFDDEVQLKIPAGFHVEELPDPWTSTLGGAKCVLGYSVQGDTIVFTFRISREGGFYDQTRYEALREAYHQLAENAKRPVLLMKGPGAGS